MNKRLEIETGVDSRGVWYVNDDTQSVVCLVSFFLYKVYFSPGESDNYKSLSL